MRCSVRNTVMALPMALLVLSAAVPAVAGSLDGTIKLGGIMMDESDGSDLSVMQETYNIYDGFNVSQIRLNSRLGSKHHLNLDLHDASLDSRRGRFSWRMLDVGEITARYDRFRQLYDRDGSTASVRESWRLGAKLTPADWLRIVGNYSLQTKTGGRLGEPAGTDSFLGSTYDYDLQTGFFEAEAHTGPRAFAVGYEMSRFTDNELAEADREGDIISARINGPCYFLPNLSHFLRGAYGTQKLTAVDTEYKIGNFQYLGVYRPASAWQVKYRFFFNRIDNEVTRLATDNIRNDFDLVWYNKLGQIFGGYGYVTNDNNKSLTENNVWRLGTVVAYQNWVKAKVSYASAHKTDQEHLTLLKDIESSRFRATLKSQPVEPLTLGVGYVDRERFFPVIDVRATGQRYSAYGRWVEQGLGALNIDFAYSDDKYDDLEGGFEADNTTVTGRLDFTMVKDLRLSFGLTWLDIGTNLDIEKSILSFEGEYAFLDDWFVEAKYNVYNYDDYILLDKYYTANVVWLNLGYNISLGQ
jgi:hypothetical protein